MTLQDLHYAFKVGLDRLSTGAKRDLNAAEIDYYLHQGQLLFIDNVLSKSKSSRLFPSALGPLFVTQPEQAPIPAQQSSSTTYKVNTALTVKPIRHLIKVDAKASCGVLPVRYVDFEQLSTALLDPFNQPSTEFLLYTFNSDGMTIYAPDNLTISEVNLSYIAEPPRVNLGTYVYLDGTQYPLQNVSVAPTAHPYVLARALALAAKDLEQGEQTLKHLMYYE